MTRKELLTRLNALSEPAYRDFSLRLTPDAGRMIGVRLPYLRKIAREIAHSSDEVFSDRDAEETFEETMLRGMVIGLLRAECEEILRCTAAFLPRIRNWAVCDSFCAGLKMAREHPEQVLSFLRRYLSSHAEFEVRFSVVMLLWYFINDMYIGDVLHTLPDIRHEGYYAQTAVAWAVSVCYTKYPERTLTLLKENRLAVVTHNLALRKISELRSTTPQQRIVVGALRRKSRI